MHKISPRCVTYKEGPLSRANRRATKDAPEDKAQGPHVSLPGEVEPGKLHLGVGRSPGSAEPGQASVQVHLGEE